ncbi:MAG: spore cortex-lytic enzyme [Halanaerobiaceae bacterium]
MKKKRYLVFILVLIMLITLYISYTGQAQKRILYYGVRDSDVRTLQRKLSQWGFYEESVDGVFGNSTSRAVKDFQRKNGLRVDGLVGEKTWQALGYRVEPRAEEYGEPEARVAFSGGVNRNDNVELIARLINAEARGEPYEGQVAVGAVLLNRVDSPAFPNTISAVIYQPLAFESVANGQINRSPTAENRRAARAAINGWDPTYGALFFWNPSKPVNRWIWSRRTIRTIGSHIFAH